MKNVMRSGAVGKLIMCILLATLITATGAYAADWGNIDWQQFAGTKLKAINIPMVVSDYGYTRERLRDFEKLTGMKIDIELVSTDALRQKLLVDFAAGRGEYDISSVGFASREEYSIAGYLEPLQKYLNNAKLTDLSWYNLDDYTKPVFSSGISSKAELVFIPYTAEYFLLWYRKDIFEKLGLGVPLDIDELRKTAEKLDRLRKEGRISAYAYIDRVMPGPGEAGWSIFCHANRYNVEIVDFENMISYLTTPLAVEYFDYYTSMCKKYGPPGSANWGWGDIGVAYKQGMLAMATAGNASYRYIEDEETSTVAGKIGYAPPPMNPGGKDPLWIWGWGINAVSKAKEAAWLFIEWATSPPLVKEMAPDYGVPARKSAYYDPLYLKAMPNQEFINSQLWMMEFGVNSNPSVLHAGYSEPADIISKEMSMVVAGIKDVEQAAEDAEKALVKIGYTPFQSYIP